MKGYDGIWDYGGYDSTYGYERYDGKDNTKATMVWWLRRNHIHGMSESPGRLSTWKLWEIVEWHEIDSVETRNDMKQRKKLEIS